MTYQKLIIIGNLGRDPEMRYTQGVVCAEYGRNYIGIELNHEYVMMAERRISKVAQQGILL